MLKNIFKLAWRNIWRSRRRTMFTSIAIVIGVMSLIISNSYITGVMNNAAETLVKTQIGHIKIAHKEYLRLERIFPKEYMIKDLKKIKKALGTLEEVSHIDERIKFSLLLSHKDINEPAIAMAVNPEAINKSMDLSGAVVAGKYISNSQNNLLIGSGLAKTLKVKSGDELLLITTDVNYSTYALPFNTNGEFETGFSVFDKHMLYIPLDKGQEMLDTPDAAHEILVFLKDPKKANIMSQKIKSILDRQFPKNQYQVISWRETDMIKSFFPMMETIFQKVLLIIMLIVGMVILNTMLMAVMERFQEIGVLKALGFKNHNIVLMIFTEAFCIGIIGAVIGGFFGSIISAWLEMTGIPFAKMVGPEIWDKIDMPLPFYGQVVYPDFTLEILISSVLFGIIITLLAVIYPAYKSSKMLPVDAFRSKLSI